MANVPEHKIRTTVVIPRKTYEALARIGEAEDRSQHYLMVKAITEYVEQHDQPQGGRIVKRESK